jgi:hypothetical protein
MIGVTLFCVLCGLAVNYPIAATALPLTCLVWLRLMRITPNWGALTFTYSIGAVLGLFPGLSFAADLLYDKPLDWWRLPAAVVVVGSAPAIGALLVCGPLLLCEAYLKRYRGSQH